MRKRLVTQLYLSGTSGEYPKAIEIMRESGLEIKTISRGPKTFRMSGSRVVRDNKVDKEK